MSQDTSQDQGAAKLCPLEQALDEARSAGFRIHNLFELDAHADGEMVRRWRANLRLDLKFEFGDGASPEEALREALRKVLKTDLRASEVAVTTSLRIEDLDL